MAEIRRPSREQIRQRAYELFMERGGEHGRDAEDWIRAEQELTIQFLFEDLARTQNQNLSLKNTTPLGYRAGGPSIWAS